MRIDAIRRLRWLRSRITGRAALDTVVLVLTHACDSRCPSCGCRAAGANELSDAEWARLATESVALGARDLLVTGGEPLQHPSIGDLLPAFARTGARVALHTNALGLADHAPLVARTCGAVYVSIDGWSPESYRRARGVDGWERARLGVAELRQSAPRIPVRARVLLTRHLVGNVRAQVDSLLSLGCDSVSFLAVDVAHPDAFGRDGRIGAARLRPAREQRTALERELWSARAAFPDRLVDSSAALQRGTHLSAEGEAGAPGCSAPWTTAVIEPDGGLRPCFFLPVQASASAGLAAVDAPAFRALRRGIRLADRPECRRCVCWKN